MFSRHQNFLWENPQGVKDFLEDIDKINKARANFIGISHIDNFF